MEFELNRFISVHQQDYQLAVAEISSGRKRSHWMWYIFPQLKGLGRSSTAQHYGIANLAEAEAFLMHPILGKHLINISNILLQLKSTNANAIFGSPDDMKLKSSMTLFSAVPGAPSVFENVLHRFYKGEKDQTTLSLLNLS